MCHQLLKLFSCQTFFVFLSVQVAKSGNTLDTIVSDQEMDEPAFKERSLMEAILAQKMARAAKFMRSNSTASIDSACSGRSNISAHSENQAG